MQWISSSEEESKKIAKQIAQHLKPSNLVLLEGDLGAGKSFFCREIIRHFCGEDTSVPSPTFNIVHPYEQVGFNIMHYDLYRIKSAAELASIGFEEMLDGNISLVEWPQLLLKSGIIKSDALYIKIKIEGNSRLIETNIV